jgi:hypothetical protein
MLLLISFLFISIHYIDGGNFFMLVQPFCWMGGTYSHQEHSPCSLFILYYLYSLMDGTCSHWGLSFCSSNPFIEWVGLVLIGSFLPAHQSFIHYCWYSFRYGVNLHALRMFFTLLNNSVKQQKLGTLPGIPLRCLS